MRKVWLNFWNTPWKMMDETQTFNGEIRILLTFLVRSLGKCIKPKRLFQYMNITDKEWEKWGARDPYYGVYSTEDFRKNKITEAAKKAFFKSGQDYVQQILAKVRAYINPDFQPQAILDFGCGVGRLVIPFSRIAARVTGIDVSESMLVEARKNCLAESIQNVDLMVSKDEALSVINERTYDLVHSYIVFQHIPVHRGERIFSSMLARLKAGGCGVLHFTYASAHISQIKMEVE
jgi:2-polyprenyl-3-methyl-5-hydroxy-6-metoxy-1,4-benzoquinol methylase